MSGHGLVVRCLTVLIQLEDNSDGKLRLCSLTRSRRRKDGPSKQMRWPIMRLKDHCMITGLDIKIKIVWFATRAIRVEWCSVAFITDSVEQIVKASYHPHTLKIGFFSLTLSFIKKEVVQRPDHPPACMQIGKAYNMSSTHTMDYLGWRSNLIIILTIHKSHFWKLDWFAYQFFFLLVCRKIHQLVLTVISFARVAVVWAAWEWNVFICHKFKKVLGRDTVRVFLLNYPSL